MRTVVIIPDELWENAKRKAVDQRVSLAEIIRRALEEFLKQEKTKKKEKR